MDEVTKALGPWPILQMVFGLVVLGLGVWSIVRGLMGKEDKYSQDDKRAEWEAYNQLQNIEQNTFAMKELLGKIAEGINRFNDNRWNGRQ